MSGWDDKPGAGDAETGEGCGAEVADQCGIDDEEERFGDQGAQRRDREVQDLAVERRDPVRAV